MSETGLRIVIYIAGIVSTGIGACMAHRFANVRLEREALRKVARTYKAAFAFGVIPPRNTNLNGTSYNETLPMFREAVSTAWIQLPSEYQVKLCKAWDEYQGEGYTPEGVLEVGSAEEVINASSELPTDDDASSIYQKYFFNLHSCLDDLL